jgi:hypothetical protein
MSSRVISWTVGIVLLVLVCGTEHNTKTGSIASTLETEAIIGMGRVLKTHQWT